MSSYPYKLLDSNSHEIRILEYSTRVSHRQQGLLSGTLKNESLIDIKPYTALSYCWGDPASNKLLRLSLDSGDGFVRICSVRITENLHSALQALFRKGEEGKPVRVWVDAICINQDDLYERGQQVQMMRQIYARAEEVIAWVGPTAGSSLSSTGLNHLLDTQLSSEAAWEARKAFFNEEYWKRVWIIQEITVASRVTMLYEDLEFSWEHLVLVLTSLLEHSVQGHPDHESAVSEIGASHILKFREHWMDSNKPISLFQALSWTLHTKATDPRDKIFALLGLCHDGFRLVPVPSYKLSLVSLISEMSRLSFSRTRSLDLMCLRETGSMPEEFTGLPSWTPNWPYLWSSGSITAHENRILCSPTSFNLDPVLAGSTSSVLNVESILIGHVNGVSSGLETQTQRATTNNTSKDWLHSTSEIPRDYKMYSDLFPYSIWRALTMNDSESRGQTQYEQCFSNLWTPQGRGSIYNTRIIDWLDENESFKICGKTLRTWSQLGDQILSERRSSRAKSNVLTAEDRGKFWDTTNQALEHVLGSGMRLAELWLVEPTLGLRGVHVALVNPQIRKSDHIFLLRGCSFPVVLRSRGSDMDSWTVVGGVWLPTRSGEGQGQVRDWLDGKIHDPPQSIKPKILSLV